MNTTTRAWLAGLLVCLCAASAAAEEWGDLVGRFVYDGKAPEPARVVIGRSVPADVSAPQFDESLLIDQKSGGLANVVVYMRTKDVAVHPDVEKNAADKVVLETKDVRFQPRVLGLWLPKQVLVAKNSDPMRHDAGMAPLEDKPVTRALFPGGEAQIPLARSQIVPIPVWDAFWPSMRGYVLPRDNPYFAVSGADGSFKLEKLPAGELEFQVWHERSGWAALDQWKKGRFTMTIKSGKNDLGEIKLPARLFEKK